MNTGEKRTMKAGEPAFELQTKTNTVTAMLLRLAKQGRVRKTTAYDDQASVYYCLQDRA